MLLKDRVALITGGAKGMGRSMAEKFAAEGCKVAIADIATDEGMKVLAEIKDKGGEGLALTCDVTDINQIMETVAKVIDAYGKIDILVNNAGTIAQHKDIEDLTEEDWDRVMGTNVTAVFRLTRAALPHLARRGGHVFMISSLAGVNPIAGMAAYCASKAALDHFASCLMLEIRQRGVKVTTLAPGSVDTEFEGAPRASETSWMLTPEDLARTVVELARTRDGAHLSRIEMRPAKPQKR